MSVDEVKDVVSPQADELKHTELNVIQQNGYEATVAVFTEVIGLGYVDPSKIRRILDFGAGLGGPTLGIIDVMRQNSPHVDAIEKEEFWINNLKELGILPPGNIIHDDGLSYLEHLGENGIPPYDLITAFSIGPDGNGRIFRGIAASAKSSLTPNGNLLITSNDWGMKAAIDACKEADVPFYFIEGVVNGKKVVRPDTLIVPQSSCIKIKPLLK